MQRIDISTLGLCEKYIVGEAGNVGLSSNLCMLLGTQIFSSSLSTATTWPHWVINKNPIDIQGQRFRQHLHVLWRQHTSACCHSESCLMFPLRLLTKPGTEFKFLGHLHIDGVQTWSTELHFGVLLQNGGWAVAEGTQMGWDRKDSNTSPGVAQGWAGLLW